VWSQMEMVTWLPYITKLTTAITAVPAAKDTCPKTRRSAAGSRAVNSRATQARKPTAKVTARNMMNLESNQSSSCPLSNMIWSAATQITSVASPQESIGAEERRIHGGSFRKVTIMKTESKPTGRLM